MDGGAVLAVRTGDPAHLGEGGGGDHEGDAAVAHRFLQFLPAKGETETVYAHYGQDLALRFEQAAGVHGPGFVGADGEKGLVDHGFQLLFLNVEGILLLHGGKLGEILRIGAHDLKGAPSAGEFDQQAGVALQFQIAVRHFSDDVAEETGVENDASFFRNVCRDPGADAGFQVIAGDGEFVLRCCQQKALQGGDGAFGRCGSCGDGKTGQQKAPIAAEFHIDAPSCGRVIPSCGSV